MVKIESEKLNDPMDKTKDIINKYVNEDSIKNPYMRRIIYFSFFFLLSLLIITISITYSINNYKKFPYFSVLLFIVFYVVTPYSIISLFDSNNNIPEDIFIKYMNVFVHSMILYSVSYIIEVTEIISYEKIKKGINWGYQHLSPLTTIPKGEEPILTKENVNQIDNLVTKIQGSIGNASKNLKSISNKINPSDISMKPIVPSISSQNPLANSSNISIKPPISSPNPLANYSNFKFNNQPQ
jgi:hypothetical protein